jgi:division protein CdvB (Snf7/Vps24/ESCRT-III family)
MALENSEQLRNTQQKIAKLELALERMRQTETPRGYLVFQQGFVALIDQMRREIDEYLGIVRDDEAADESLDETVEALSAQLAALSQSTPATPVEVSKPRIGDSEGVLITTH